MDGFDEIDPRVVLRRIAAALDEGPPTDEDARATCEAMGIDVDGLHARILARIAAHAAGIPPGEEPAPVSHLRDRRTFERVAEPAEQEAAAVEPPRPTAPKRTRRRKTASAAEPDGVLERAAGTDVPDAPIVKDPRRPRARKGRRGTPRR
jgi:hypothetical protein